MDSFEPDKVLLYSPKHDQWSEKDLSATSYWAGNGNYFYLNYSGLNQTLLYDGFTNQEFTFPSAQISQHVFSRDSVFLMYTNTGKYIGYSPVEHDTSEYTTPRLQGQQWSNYIVLALNVSGSRYEHLLYDGYNNNFAPLILTAQHGIRRYAWPGGKTALVMTDNGYLFAYYPGATTNIDINPYDKDAIIATPRLHQNYPNPFNPTTLIKFDLPITQNVTLKIYNVLGQLVDTLIDNPLTAGPHEYQWEAVNKASGLYYYVLEAGDHKLIKKMILMK